MCVTVLDSDTLLDAMKCWSKNNYRIFKPYLCLVDDKMSKDLKDKTMWNRRINFTRSVLPILLGQAVMQLSVIMAQEEIAPAIVGHRKLQTGKVLLPSPAPHSSAGRWDRNKGALYKQARRCSTLGGEASKLMGLRLCSSRWICSITRQDGQVYQGFDSAKRRCI